MPARDRDDDRIAPIVTRAWTFQERLLAQRCLIFRCKEIIWECKCECKCECGAESSLRPQLLPGLPKPGSSMNNFPNHNTQYEFWRRAVEDYSSRKLKFVRDRLPAISALASVLGSSAENPYLAGLWKRDSVNLMRWKCKTPEYGVCASPDGYIAPSWSWAACPFPVS